MATTTAPFNSPVQQALAGSQTSMDSDMTLPPSQADVVASIAGQSFTNTASSREIIAHGRFFLCSNPEEAKQYFKSAVIMSQALQNTEEYQAAQKFYNISVRLIELSDQLNNLILRLEQERTNNNLNSPLSLNLLREKGRTHLDLAGQYEIAEDYLYANSHLVAALEISRTFGDHPARANILEQMMKNYQQLKDTFRVIHCLEQILALPEVNSTLQPNRLVSHTQQLADVFAENGRHSEALTLYQACLTALLQMNGETELSTQIQEKMVSIQEALKQ